MKTQLVCIALVGSLFFVSCDKDENYEIFELNEQMDSDVHSKTAIEKHEIKESDC